MTTKKIQAVATPLPPLSILHWEFVYHTPMRPDSPPAKWKALSARLMKLIEDGVPAHEAMQAVFTMGWVAANDKKTRERSVRASESVDRQRTSERDDELRALYPSVLEECNGKKVLADQMTAELWNKNHKGSEVSAITVRRARRLIITGHLSGRPNG